MTVHVVNQGRKITYNSKETSDLYKTPDWAIDLLVPYLNPRWRVWEPCLGEGNIKERLEFHGYQVLGSDLTTGVDFLGLPRDLVFPELTKRERIANRKPLSFSSSNHSE